MFNYRTTMVLWVGMMLSCNIGNAYGCAAGALDNPRFTSATSFVAGEESYRLSDMVKVQDGAQDYAADWIKGKALKVAVAGKGEEDRYGRCAVYMLDADTNYSLQYALVREGLAIGYNEKSGRFVSALQGAEKQARGAKKGVWKGDVVIAADDTPNHIGSFAIIEGVVKNIYNHKKGHVMLNFDDDWKADFTVFIPNFSAKKFEKGYLNGLKDKKIEARGVLYERNGPSISLLNKNYLIKHSN